jgi:uncharacterized protein (DUF58 family)
MAGTVSNAAPDLAALMRLRDLELRARRVVEGFWHGLHRSRLHGASVEFSEYRAYTKGDDPRHIDWKLMARTDRVFIRKYEAETQLRCHLVVDASPSMRFGSGAYSKAEYARTLAATLAHFLFRQGDAAGLVTFDSRIVEYLPARRRPGHLRLLMHALEKWGPGGQTDLAAPLRRVAEVACGGGMVVLVSDLLAPLETWEGALALLAAAGQEVVIFQVLDRAEKVFEFGAPARFQDLETGKELVIDPEQARAGYLERFERHLGAVREMCRRLGVQQEVVITDQPLEEALERFLQTRRRMSRGMVRNRGGAG